MAEKHIIEHEGQTYDLRNRQEVYELFVAVGVPRAIARSAARIHSMRRIRNMFEKSTRKEKDE